MYKFTSNFKELKTLLLSLQNLRLYGDLNTIRHSTVFYFTENTVTYYIGASGSSSTPLLHELISSIRLLEIELDIHLMVIHIPDVVMIDQGTDGLSRCIWMDNLQSLMDEREMLRAIFAPVIFHESLLPVIVKDVPDIEITNGLYYHLDSH